MQSIQKFLSKVRIRRMRGQIENVYTQVVQELSEPMDTIEEAMKKLLELSLSKSNTKVDSKGDFLEILSNTPCWTRLI